MNREIQATLVTDDFRGDHAAEVKIALEIDDDETIYQFMERIFDKHKKQSNDYRYQDYIELRLKKPKNK